MCDSENYRITTLELFICRREYIEKFIKWIYEKLDMGAENNLIRDFERENNILLDPEKQIKKEEREMELDLER